LRLCSCEFEKKFEIHGNEVKYIPRLSNATQCELGIIPDE